uniref:Uncharacterized protein n=1 Tax=Rhizophora mucronata TaxID=61149 RepID=A0A2P2QQH1_RHIMU
MLASLQICDSEIHTFSHHVPFEFITNLHIMLAFLILGFRFRMRKNIF